MYHSNRQLALGHVQVGQVSSNRKRVLQRGQVFCHHVRPHPAHWTFIALLDVVFRVLHSGQATTVSAMPNDTHSL